jgi:hypothetical protein
MLRDKLHSLGDFAHVQRFRDQSAVILYLITTAVSTSYTKILFTNTINHTHPHRICGRIAVMWRAGQIAVRRRWLQQLVIAALFALVCRCGGEAPTPSGGDASLEGSASSTGGCSQPCDLFGLTCCNGQCRDLHNDPRNCGGCSVTCSDAAPFCGGQCTEQPCDHPNVPSLTPAAPLGDVAACGANACCGSDCCSPGQICCALSVWGIGCYTPKPGENSCPVGCAGCR